MATIAELLAEARRHKQAGDKARAEQICHEILRAEPTNVDALHLLGICLHATGKLAEAVEQY
jgi:Flp pilus assembly protein TadD